MLYINVLLNLVVMIIIILISVSFYTLFERKLLSYVQLRKGPNKVGINGILQAIGDGVKLFTKEYFFMFKVSKFIFIISPLLMFLISFLIWILFPFMYNLISLNNYMMIMICLLSLNVYPVMYAGIFSSSIYSMLGGLRSICQTISYEVSFILLIFSLLLLVESLNLNSFFSLKMMVLSLMFPLSILIYVSILAELNRTPFDFSEGESELISGFNIEFMSSGFAFMFLAEYSNIFFMNLIFVMMNFGGGLNVISYLFWLLMIFFVILIRGVLPRFRYDKLMFMVWKNYLPISMNYLFYIMMVKYYLFMSSF